MAGRRKTISISQEVWNRIEKLGRFGESVDDVLRRHLPGGRLRADRVPTRRKIATRRLSPNLIRQGALILGWDGVEAKALTLPKKTDTPEIRRLIATAQQWAERGGATPGQINAIRKTLNDAGFYAKSPRRNS